MSQNKLKEINGDGGGSNKGMMNGTSSNSADLNARKAALTPLEYRVTQQRETERPFSNKYNRFWENGTYHCIVCDAELFRSETKFESKSGWPAFYNVVDPQRVKLTPDLSHVGANLLLLVSKPDLARTEVSCANCNAHLGHLFKDGPKPTGLRYCINSSSLNFKSTDGTTINNLSSPTPVSNGNGVESEGQIREYICNPENTCSRMAFTPSPPPPNSHTSGSKSLASTPTTAKDFCVKNPNASARENFFSSLESNCNSLPPMGALCLNNQSCQRMVSKKPGNDDIFKKSIISNGAENHVTNGNSNGSFNGLSNSNSKANTNPKFSNKSSSVSSSTNKNGTGTTSIQISTSKTNTINTPTVPVTSVTLTVTTNSNKSNKFSFSKGASLTAARINFFQKIASSKDSPSPPSRWAAAFNSRWSSSGKNSSSSSSPSSSNNTNTQNGQDQENMIIGNGSSNSSASSSRFPSSCSSGSLCTVSRQPRPGDLPLPPQPRRSTSSFFANSTIHSPHSILQSPTIEQVSISPQSVALRETTL